MHMKTHNMRSQNNKMHTIRLNRISHVFRGRAAETNKKILKILALNGPMTIYDLHKKFFKKRDYSVINRRVRSLTVWGLYREELKEIRKMYPPDEDELLFRSEVEEALSRAKTYPEDGYVMKVGVKRAEKTGNEIPVYGLTLKGALLSLLLIDYDQPEKMTKLLKVNDHIPFYKIFFQLIDKGRLNPKIVKELFLDELKNFILEGEVNIDLIDDYKLLRYAGLNIRIRSKKFEKLFKRLEREKAQTLINAIINLGRLSHPESATEWLQKYFSEKLV